MFSSTDRLFFISPRLLLSRPVHWVGPLLLGALAGCGNAHEGASGDDDGDVCGNGFVEQTEQCDDGNTVDDDGCSSACEFEFCGNGRVDRGEDCDGEDFCDFRCRDTREALADADEDGISDLEEGDLDTDGDGTLDREDTDSDGDGLADMLEAGDTSTNTLAVDSDGDGVPDYRDPDSDDDRMLDADEGLEDPDMDGIPNFLDLDSDGDGILDAAEGGADLDGDGVPNAYDLDADGDGLSDESEGDGDSDGDGAPNYLDVDSDGDGVPDDVEGAGSGLDTDGDGIPDYLDPEADGDGIPDAVEGSGDADGDGIVNSLDLDSDGNGIPDEAEGTFDADGDGIPDFLDLDADGDGITDIAEIGPSPSEPVDTDADGTPDYLDTDSDGDYVPDADELALGLDPTDPDTDDDTIFDLEDGVDDRDGDGTVNALDLDSDDDGFLDSVEAGDSDPETFPADSDGDGQPDFVDRDSDADGLLDLNEVNCPSPTGSSRLVRDTDGDGFSDLSEFVIGPDGDSSGVDDLCEAAVGVRDFVEFYFELPQGGSEDSDVLQFAPQVQRADVFFSVDTTGSMGGEISNLRSSLSTPTTGIIDSTRARVADSAFGVSSWQDFPACGFGGQAGSRPVDELWELLQTPTTDSVAAQAAADALTTRWGADFPEAGYESLYQLATGEGASWTGTYAGTTPAYTGPGRGGVGFRDGSVPIVLHVTDALSHTKADYDMCLDIPSTSSHTKEEAFTALQGLGARVITVQSGTRTDVASQLLEISDETGAVVPVCAFQTGAGAWRCGADQCCTGISGAAQAPDANDDCTLKYSISNDGSGLGDAVVDGVDAILKYGKFDVIAAWRDDGDAGTIDTACFIKRIETLAYIPPPAEPEASCNPVPTQVSSGVAWNNVFEGFAAGTSDPARPGASLQYTVVAQNDGCVAPTQEAQLFTVLIDVMDVASGSVLDTQTMTVIVPPEIPEEF